MVVRATGASDFAGSVGNHMNGTADREVGLLDYAHVVASRKWIVVTAVVAAVVGAVALSALQTPIYEASAEMLVSTRSSDTIFGNGNITVGDPKRAVLTEIKVLESEIVSQRAQQNLALASSLPAVNGISDNVTDVVTVSVRSGDPTSARIAADAYMQAYIEIKREQSVDTLVSAGAELQKKITELQTQIDALAQQVADATATEEAAGSLRQRLSSTSG